MSSLYLSVVHVGGKEAVIAAVRGKADRQQVIVGASYPRDLRAHM